MKKVYPFIFVILSFYFLSAGAVFADSFSEAEWQAQIARQIHAERGNRKIIQHIYENTAELQEEEIEHYIVFFYTDSMDFIEKRHIATGTETSVRFYKSTIVSTAKEMNATKIITLHNHPNHACKPSSSDIRVREKSFEYYDKHGITLYDDLIHNGKNCIFSWKGGGKFFMLY